MTVESVSNIHIRIYKGVGGRRERISLLVFVLWWKEWGVGRD